MKAVVWKASTRPRASFKGEVEAQIGEVHNLDTVERQILTTEAMARTKLSSVLVDIQ